MTTNFVGTGLGTTAYPRVTANAGAAITTKGYEQLDFAANATLDEAGAGSNTYAWAVAQAPAGSSVATGDIVSPTSLTGAHIAAGDLDMPGVYVFELTVTDEDTETGTSTVSVLVGTADGGIYRYDIDTTALSTIDWKIAGDGVKTIGVAPNSVDLTLANAATITSVGIVSGTGVQGVCAASTSARLVTTTAAHWAKSGRKGSYAWGYDVTIAGMSADFQESSCFYRNAAGAHFFKVGIQHKGLGTGQRVAERTGSSATTATTSIGSHAVGMRISGLDAQAVCKSGSWGADIDWSGETIFQADGTNIESVNPGVASSFDWSTDELWIYRWSSTTGAPVYTYTRMWAIWYP